MTIYTLVTVVQQILSFYLVEKKATCFTYKENNIDCLSAIIIQKIKF